MPIGRLMCASGMFTNGRWLSVSVSIPVYLNTARIPMSRIIVRIKNSFFFFGLSRYLSTSQPPA